MSVGGSIPLPSVLDLPCSKEYIYSIEWGLGGEAERPCRRLLTGWGGQTSVVRVHRHPHRPIAQLDRARDFESRCCKFEPCSACSTPYGV